MRKDVIIFGTGSYFENYMLCYGNSPDRRPLFAVDNDTQKQGARGTLKSGSFTVPTGSCIWRHNFVFGLHGPYACDTMYPGNEF